MSETAETHTATLHWSGTDDPFTYETYSRAHTVRFGSGVEIPASSAPSFRGASDRVNPEEQLLGALASCHMLTFLAIAAKKRLTVVRYVDDASCVLDKNAEGRMAVVSAALRPTVTFADGVDVDDATLARLHESAHRNCFIANSVNFPVSLG